MSTEAAQSSQYVQTDNQPSQSDQSRDTASEETVERESSDDHFEEESVQPLSLDHLFGVLKNQRRRLVVQYILEREEPVTIGTLAEHIAARENDTTTDALSSQERKRVYVGLYQCHLPKLDDVGVITFDKPRGWVTPGPNASQLAPYLETTPRTSPNWPYYYLTLTGVGGILVVTSSFVGAWSGLSLATLFGGVLLGFFVLSLAHLAAISDEDRVRHSD